MGQLTELKISDPLIVTVWCEVSVKSLWSSGIPASDSVQKTQLMWTKIPRQEEPHDGFDKVGEI